MKKMLNKAIIILIPILSLLRRSIVKHGSDNSMPVIIIELLSEICCVSLFLINDWDKTLLEDVDDVNTYSLYKYHACSVLIAILFVIYSGLAFLRDSFNNIAIIRLSLLLIIFGAASVQVRFAQGKQEKFGSIWIRLLLLVVILIMIYLQLTGLHY